MKDDLFWFAGDIKVQMIIKTLLIRGTSSYVSIHQLILILHKKNPILIIFSFFYQAVFNPELSARRARRASTRSSARSAPGRRHRRQRPPRSRGALWRRGARRHGRTGHDGAQHRPGIRRVRRFRPAVQPRVRRGGRDRMPRSPSTSGRTSPSAARGSRSSGTETKKRRWLPQCASGERRRPHSASPSRARIRRAGHAHPGRSFRRRHATTPQRREDLDLQRGLRRRLTVFAKVPVEVDGKAKSRVTAFIVRCPRAGSHARQDRGEDGSRRATPRTVSFRDVRVPAGDAGRGRRGLPHRARDPQFRPVGALGGIGPRHRAASSTSRPPSRRSASSSAARSAPSRWSRRSSRWPRPSATPPTRAG